MSEATKYRLICATRQYRHNTDNSPDFFNPKEGFVNAYDREEVDALVGELQADNEALRARVAELEAVVSGVKRIAEAEPKDTAILRLIGARIPADAWLLRQKARAIEEAASCFGGRDYAEIRLGLSEQAQSLRNAAEQVERGGSDA